MVRNRGKKALYEVMSKARVKTEPGKAVEDFGPTRPDEYAPEARQENVAGVPKAAAKWWRKPRIVQLNAGRIEFSMPYQIAVVLLLGFIFLVIAAYRLGQSSYPAQQQVVKSEPVQRDTDSETQVEQASSNIIPPPAPAEDTTAKTEVVEPAEPTGNNVIVLVQYHSLADLAPVQAYFAEHGIELDIDPQQGSYFLQTRQLYDNPSRPGTDGYKALQKIKEVGKGYKAPKGYETFASKLFQDAYGKKVK
ncbi:MAG: hypothetical protein ACYSTT_08220 [Planctomycetota bacterium]|jgi:hypothetical protein